MPTDDDYPQPEPVVVRTPPETTQQHTHYHLHLAKGTGAQGDSATRDAGPQDAHADDEPGEKGGDKDKEGNQDADGGTPPKQPRNKKPLIILAIVVVIVAIVAYFVWFAKRNQVSTDDAYTDGDAITMAPKVSGYVSALYVDDNTHVHKGDLLLRIEQSDYDATRGQDRAELASARSTWWAGAWAAVLCCSTCSTIPTACSR